MVLPEGLHEGDIITLEGHYEPHADQRHVYTQADILILWRVEGNGLTRIPPPRKIPRTRKRLMEEKPWWDGWHQSMVRKWSQVRPSDPQ